MAVRIWGGIAALVFAVLLGWVGYLTFRGPHDTVTPVVRVVPGSATSAAEGAGPGSASGQTAQAPSDVLAQRTRLQAEQTVASGSRSESLEDQSHALEMRGGVDNGRGLVQDWLKPPANSEKLLQPSQFRSGVSSLPYRETNVLVQPQGRDFRVTHNDRVRYGGGWLIFGTCLALALFLLGRGRIKIAEGRSGEELTRFSATERANHWMTATSFLLMAVTGLVVLYGKPLLLPLLGESSFSTLAQASAWTHMAFAVPFVLGVLLMIMFWLRQNLFTRLDWEWLKRGGGFLRDDGHNPPAARFNAGQKLIFWGVVLGGLAMLATGLTLMYPFYWFGYTGMQWAQIAHAGIGLGFMALIIGHIYIGTVGMEGAIDAMWSGLVDRNWAKEHHQIWFNTLSNRGEARANPKAGKGG